MSLVKNTPQPIRNFTPGDNHNSGPNRTAFQAALDDYYAAIAAGNLDAARAAEKQSEAMGSTAREVLYELAHSIHT